MMKRLSFVMGLFLVLWITPPARTQETRTGPTVAEANPPSRTEARVLYQAWRSLQRQNSRTIQRISVKERLDSRFDGPTGSWSTSVDLSLLGYPDQPGWQIDIEDPHDGSVVVSLQVHSGSIVTSGTDYRRWTTADGASQHHIITISLLHHANTYPTKTNPSPLVHCTTSTSKK